MWLGDQFSNRLLLTFVASFEISFSFAFVVGGGMGLNLGKNKVSDWVESFGGRVTKAVSGKTDILIVGKEPGAFLFLCLQHPPKTIPC